MSAPSDYEEEAAFCERALAESCDGECRHVLELGSGGGNNASHMKRRFTMVLADRSPGMLAVSRALNPECEHVEGDMRTLRLIPAVRRDLRPRRRLLHDDRAAMFGRQSRPRSCTAVPAAPCCLRPITCARRSGRQPIMAGTMERTAPSGLPGVDLGSGSARQHIHGRLRLRLARARRLGARGAGSAHRRLVLSRRVAALARRRGFRRAGGAVRSLGTGARHLSGVYWPPAALTIRC